MSEAIEHVLEETRTFDPPAAFVAKANLKSRADYDRMYKESIENPEGFWGKIAEEFHWYRKWRRVLNADNPPFYKWFEGGTTNISYNCLDRHLDGPRKNKAAILWEGEPGDQRTLTYQQLHREVCKAANALKALGLKKGDRVAIYMPMVPELPIAMLACARIGAVHSVIFGGFSVSAIVDRVQDASCKMVITADGGYRRGSVLPL
jgi:acetyl-CoA synthetase